MSKRDFGQSINKLSLLLIFVISVFIMAISLSCAPEASPAPLAITPTPLLVPQNTPLAVSTPIPTKPVELTPSPVSSTPPPAAPVPAAKTPPGFVTPEVVDSSEAAYMSDSFSIKAYQSKPKGAGPFPAIIIIHENRGLQPHTEDVARRFANQGYVALAPDLLSRSGGTAQFATTDEAVAAIGKLS